MKTKEEEKEASDLEDGEIKEDVLEDISDCSMSEIVTIKKDLDNEDHDIDLLREEALKSMYAVEEDNEEELEEELYRLEALKSLLKNIELSEKSSDSETAKKRRPKRKKKRESNHRGKKSKASTKDSTLVSPPSQPVTEKENQLNEVPTGRSWYPKIEFALISTLPVEENQVVKSEKSKIEVKSALVRRTVNAIHTPNMRSVSYTRQISPSKNQLIRSCSNKSSLIKPYSFKKVTKHCIRKFDSNIPINRVNSFTLQNAVEKRKYKLTNQSKYVVNKLPSSKINGSLNHSLPKSLFSINRLKYPQLAVAPKEFIINLDDEDSDCDEEENLHNGCAREMPVCDIKKNRDEISTTKQSIERTMECDPTESKLSSSKKFEINGSSNVTDQIHRKENSAVIPVQVELQKESVINPPQLSKSLNKAAVVTKSDAVKTKLLDREIEPKGVMEKSVDANIRDVSVLEEAEAYMIKIREKLSSDLDELDKTVKLNTIEREKLNALLKKLRLLKAMVTKLEAKIELQRSRMSANVACLNCLLSGVQTRTLTCSKFEEVCLTVGKNLMGPLYKPPSKLESVIAEKRKVIDFSKCQSAVELK